MDGATLGDSLHTLIYFPSHQVINLILCFRNVDNKFMYCLYLYCLYLYCVANAHLK